METEDIEVGFTNFGAIVGVLGTLRAVNSDAFVARMSLKVTRRADNATHAFDWGAFRSMQFTPSDDSLIRCSSFLLFRDYGAPYHVAFIDRDTQSKVRSIIEKVQKAWYEACRGEVGDTRSRNPQEIAQLFTEAQNSLRARLPHEQPHRFARVAEAGSASYRRCCVRRRRAFANTPAMPVPRRKSEVGSRTATGAAGVQRA